MKLSLHMNNVLRQSNQMHSPLGVFVRFYLICLIKFSTKNIKNTCANSHNKCCNYLINIFTITFGFICLVAKNNIKTVLYSEIKQKDQQLYTTCFPLFFHKHLENLKLYYNLINAEKII